MVTPGVTGGPAVLFQIIRGGSKDIRNRVNDIAMSVAVEIHSIFLESRRHELSGPKSARPGSDESVRPHVAVLKDFQR